MQPCTACRLYPAQSAENRKTQSLLVLLTGEKHLAIATVSFETISGDVYVYMNMPSCQIAKDACSGGDNFTCGQEIKVSGGACAPLHLHVSPCTIQFHGRILLIYSISILWYFKLY